MQLANVNSVGTALTPPLHMQINILKIVLGSAGPLPSSMEEESLPGLWAQPNLLVLPPCFPTH